MMLGDRNAAGIELRDALAIDVRANYVVSCFGETRPGNQTYVSTAND
jgi:hypothetical protein